MNYQCQFLVTDNLTGVLYESSRHTFFHDYDIIHLKWKDVLFVISNNTPQTFHVYLEPYLLEGMVLKSGRIHWFSAPFETKMQDECTKIQIAGKRVKIALFMHNLSKYQHKMLAVVQYVRPSKRCSVVGRAQHIFEELDKKRVYTWLSAKEAAPFPGVRLLKEASTIELVPLISPKRSVVTEYMPDNPFYSNDIFALPLVIDAETVAEIKFYNDTLFLFEVVIKQNLFCLITPRVSPRERTFCPELQTYAAVVNDFFVFELDYYFSKGLVTILTMRIIVKNYKVGLNLDHSKGGITV